MGRAALTGVVAVACSMALAAAGQAQGEVSSSSSEQISEEMRRELDALKAEEAAARAADEEVIDINNSAVSSLFGYYVGGQDGTTLSVAFDIIY